MAIIAGLGLAIGILCAAIMSRVAVGDYEYLFTRPPMNHFDQFYQHIIWAGCTIGLLLATIGGIFGRPRYFWPPFVVVGAVYLIASCLVMLAEQRYGGVVRISLMTLWIASPGIVFIIEGLIIRHLRRRKEVAVGL
jgi:hypothetical protein